MSEHDPEIEYSSLCGEVTRDGMTVTVQIYRILDSGDEWALEVVDQEGGSTVWKEGFPTDRDAYRAFFLTIEREGIATFLTGKQALH